jgi:hypothetical protein
MIVKLECGGGKKRTWAVLVGLTTLHPKIFVLRNFYKELGFKKMFEPQEDEVSKQLSILHNEELHILYRSRNRYRVLIRKPLRKLLLEVLDL